MGVLSFAILVLLRTAWAGISDCAPFQGEVRHQKTGDLVYQVFYTLNCPANGHKSVKTVFEDGHGKELAHETDTESEIPYVFNVDFEDKRNGRTYEIRVKKKDEKNVVEIVTKTGDKTKTKIFDDPDHLMTRSGAIEYIRDNLKKLADGETLKGRFLVVSRLEAYAVRFRGKLIENGTEISVSIELSNPFYRIFAPKMNLIYDRRENTLVRFKGNGSLLDVNDKPIPVDVVYHQGLTVGEQKSH